MIHGMMIFSKFSFIHKSDSDHMMGILSHQICKHNQLKWARKAKHARQPSVDLLCCTKSPGKLLKNLHKKVKT